MHVHGAPAARCCKRNGAASIAIGDQGGLPAQRLSTSRPALWLAQLRLALTCGPSARPAAGALPET